MGQQKTRSFDLIVIGAGSAGLVAAVQARGLRKSVLMIEKSKSQSVSKFLNDIPLRTLAYFAELMNDHQNLVLVGIKNGGKIDPELIMSEIRARTKKLSSHTAANEIKKLGISFVYGAPSFIDKDTVAVGTKHYFGTRIIIATGSKPVLPDLAGADSQYLLTSETFFRLKKLPKSIAILGAGPAGCQFAVNLARLGVKVVVLEKEQIILPREDDEMRQLVMDNLKELGVEPLLNVSIEKLLIDKRKGTIEFINGKKRRKVTAERIIACCGRLPNIAGLALENAGIKHSAGGIDISRHMRTNVKHIFACGDVTGGYFYTNRAEGQAAIAFANALGGSRPKMDYRSMIWSLALLPDLVHLGMTAREAERRYGALGIRIYKFSYRFCMNSAIRGSARGMAKIICRPNGKIVGGHIYGERSAEVAHELQLARMNGINFGKLSFTMHIFPSYGDVLTKPSLRCYIEHYKNNLLINGLRALLPHRRS